MGLGKLRRFALGSRGSTLPVMRTCFSTWFSAVCLTVFATSCGIFPGRAPHKAKAVLYQWNDDGGPGEVSVDIDLSEQIATYKRGERVIGWSFVSTGKEGHATSTGNYTILEKLPLKVSDRYGWIADEAGNVTNGDATPKTPVPPGDHYTGAPMHNWMRVTTYGVGMHAGEIPRPGEAASHGCIRLPRDFVPKLYDVTKVGTPVTITRGKARTNKKPGDIG
jgi:L,D-transpeptidase catalytic domain